MRVLEPFFNNNYDESYTRLKNRTKEILAQQVDFESYLLCSILCDTTLHPHATKIHPVLKILSHPLSSYFIVFYCTLPCSTLLRSTLFFSTLLPSPIRYDIT